MIDDLFENNNFLKNIIDFLVIGSVEHVKIIRQKNNFDINGLYDAEANKIYISTGDNMSLYERRITIIHEFLHYYEDVTRKDLNIDKDKTVEQRVYDRIYGGQYESKTRT